MADELISRQALIKLAEHSKRNNTHRAMQNQVAHKHEHEHFLRMIDSVPAVDAVALPCNIGEKLYSVDGKIAEVEEFLIGRRGISMTVSFECDYNCEECAFNSWRQEYCGEYSCDGEWGEMAIPATEIGKSLFRTYEEAKAERWKRREENAAD